MDPWFAGNAAAISNADRAMPRRWDKVNSGAKCQVITDSRDLPPWAAALHAFRSIGANQLYGQTIIVYLSGTCKLGCISKNAEAKQNRLCQGTTLGTSRGRAVLVLVLQRDPAPAEASSRASSVLLEDEDYWQSRRRRKGI